MENWFKIVVDDHGKSITAAFFLSRIAEGIIMSAVAGFFYIDTVVSDLLPFFFTGDGKRSLFTEFQMDTLGFAVGERIFAGSVQNSFAYIKQLQKSRIAGKFIQIEPFETNAKSNVFGFTIATTTNETMTTPTNTAAALIT